MNCVNIRMHGATIKISNILVCSITVSHGRRIEVTYIELTGFVGLLRYVLPSEYLTSSTTVKC